MLTYGTATGFGLPFGIAGKYRMDNACCNARNVWTGTDRSCSVANVQEPIDDLRKERRHGHSRAGRYRVASENEHRHNGIVQILLKPFHMSFEVQL